MTPDRPPPSAAVLEPKDCASVARALWSELEQARIGLGNRAPGRRTDLEWTKFRTEWLTKVHAAHARCQPQKNLFAHLENLIDLYSTHAVQFSGEIGPTIDAFNAELDAVK